MAFRWLPLLLSASVVTLAHADGPADNLPANVRPIPPRGIKIPEADRSELRAGLDRLSTEISAARTALAKMPDLLKLLPDVQIYESAVRTALDDDEFFEVKELAAAKTLLAQGLERANQLRDGKATWNSATGLVVRGYVSKIDGSVQPYGLVVPASYVAKTPYQFRLDVWCHGRGEKLSEMSFISGRQTSPGEFVPPNTFVLHPYGRYCNANKFAGEIDLFEAIEDIKTHYPIDERRLVIRGFSMGGAACWQFAVHYPSAWAAAAPGAGFSETADFLRVFQDERLQPSWYEQKLWHLYDCTDYALNLFNCPTIAYSGERDRQKQAALMMAAALKNEGIEMVHIIGAGAGHQYTPEAKAEINRRIDAIAGAGRDLVPKEIHFTTWTLRYNHCSWIEVDGLEQHWERASVDCKLVGDTAGPQIKTRNVSALSVAIPAGGYPLDIRAEPRVRIDGVEIKAPKPLSDRSWTAHFQKVGGMWKVVPSANDGELRKRHGLQGPIDDAFMDSFLNVRPTGPSLSEKAGRWTTTEMNHAIDHWRRQFRGRARIKDDKDVTESDIAAHHLVLWGDPGSNAILAKIIEKLPLQWTTERVRLGDHDYDSSHHVPVMIYPNPLNRKRYVVLNSGFTFREYDYLNNARQVPKLPDFAMIDVDVPPSARAPGRIVTAGFFSEDWKMPTLK